ncbi:hypothetical protein LTR66_008802 [Elasticomyces elasticus]|nr:hypothetical protein LTR66_008802 [Elasticomyces elasticus]
MANLLRDWLGHTIERQLELALAWKQDQLSKIPTPGIKRERESSLDAPKIKQEECHGNSLYSDDGSNLRIIVRRPLRGQNSFVQLVQFTRFEEPIQCRISDGYTSATATLSAGAVKEFVKLRKRRITENTEGGLLNVQSFEIAATPYGSRDKRVSLRITEFDYQGASGNGQIGHPQLVSAREKIKHTLRALDRIRQDETGNTALNVGKDREASLADQLPTWKNIGGVPKMSNSRDDGNNGDSAPSQVALATQALPVRTTPRNRKQKSRIYDDIEVLQGVNLARPVKAGHLMSPEMRGNTPKAIGSNATDVLLGLLRRETNKTAIVKDAVMQRGQAITSDVDGLYTDKLLNVRQIVEDDSSGPEPLKAVEAAYQDSNMDTEEVRTGGNDSVTDPNSASHAVRRDARSGRPLTSAKLGQDKLNWLTMDRIRHVAVEVSDDQRRVLDKKFSWIPDVPGYPFPPGNIPQELLGTFSKAAVREASCVVEAADAGAEKALSEAEDEDEESVSSSESEVGSEDWPPSSPPKPCLPPNSSALMPEGTQHQEKPNFSDTENILDDSAQGPDISDVNSDRNAVSLKAPPPGTNESEMDLEYLVPRQLKKPQATIQVTESPVAAQTPSNRRDMPEVIVPSTFDQPTTLESAPTPDLIRGTKTKYQAHIMPDGLTVATESEVGLRTSQLTEQCRDQSPLLASLTASGAVVVQEEDGTDVGARQSSPTAAAEPADVVMKGTMPLREVSPPDMQETSAATRDTKPTPTLPGRSCSVHTDVFKRSPMDERATVKRPSEGGLHSPRHKRVKRSLPHSVSWSSEETAVTEDPVIKYKAHRKEFLKSLQHAQSDQRGVGPRLGVLQDVQTQAGRTTQDPRTPTTQNVNTLASSPSTSQANQTTSKADCVSTLHSLFDRFKCAYPEYTGDLKHFSNLCRKLHNIWSAKSPSKLNILAQEADGFVVRHKLLYLPYLVQSADEGQDPIAYEEYFCRLLNQDRRPTYHKTIIKPEALESAFNSAAAPASSQGFSHLVLPQTLPQLSTSGRNERSTQSHVTSAFGGKERADTRADAEGNRSSVNVKPRLLANPHKASEKEGGDSMSQPRDVDHTIRNRPRTASTNGFVQPVALLEQPRAESSQIRRAPPTGPRAMNKLPAKPHHLALSAPTKPLRPAKGPLSLNDPSLAANLTTVAIPSVVKTNNVHSMSSSANAVGPSTLPKLVKSEVARLGEFREPRRTSEWLHAMFEEDGDFKLKQSTIWKAYKEFFFPSPPHTSPTDFFKQIQHSFPKAATERILDASNGSRVFYMTGLRPRQVLPAPVPVRPASPVHATHGGQGSSRDLAPSHEASSRTFSSRRRPVPPDDSRQRAAPAKRPRHSNDLERDDVDRHLSAPSTGRGQTSWHANPRAPRWDNRASRRSRARITQTHSKPPLLEASPAGLSKV